MIVTFVNEGCISLGTFDLDAVPREHDAVYLRAEDYIVYYVRWSSEGHGWPMQVTVHLRKGSRS